MLPPSGLQSACIARSLAARSAGRCAGIQSIGDGLVVHMEVMVFWIDSPGRLGVALAGLSGGFK